MKQHSVLCLVIQDEKILLGLRKKDPRKSTWSGYGGKVEQGESVLEAAKRELFEEAGIRALAVDAAGIITFSSPKYKDNHVMHLFWVSKFSGKPKETNEMFPQWFHLSKIPYKKMSVTDTHWMPPLLKGQRITGHFDMSERYEIQDVDMVFV
jgi:8-oxo-dGTP diphosphatase/2-hydroxy-dATP diphosphatase